MLSSYEVNVVLEGGRKFPRATSFITIRLGTRVAHSTASRKRGERGQLQAPHAPNSCELLLQYFLNVLINNAEKIITLSSLVPQIFSCLPSRILSSTGEDIWH